MAQTDQHILPNAPYTILVTFEWGDPTSTARYTRWDESLTVDAQAFASVPSLSAKPGSPFEGGTSPDKVDIKIPASLPPFDEFIKPWRHPLVTVTVEELSPGDDTTRRVLFKGTIDKVSLRGTSKIVAARCSSFRSKLGRAKLGVQCLTNCVNTYGEGYCQADKAGQTLTGTAQTSFGVDNSLTRCTVSLAGSPTINSDRFAHGYIERDGLRIEIRQVADEGTNPNPTVKIDLKERMPMTWEGQSVSVVPGCDGQLASCQDPFRDQEENFLGLGYAMVPFNPTIEREPF